MRIATWNVERPANATSPRSRRILAKIAAIDADIWILTETHGAITPGPTYTGYRTDPAPEPPTRHLEGERRAMIWSRFPVREQISEDISHRTACVRVEMPSGDLRVAALHRIGSLPRM